ncbi:TolC family protein [Flavobacterium luteum]|uniref:TolC family protein n=1 Tax=Flavobacterium luteum TaxID=2026654 RepID=A0A7J5AF92_9FLAO|nr:TolC family protein [Flavobacterium luteum]KAB1156215.1 TolC family protein [Flavobacterium luteum]
MKKIIYFALVFIAVFSQEMQSQTKKWTIEDCVNYALENNITIKQSQLDSQLATIDKTAAIGSFLPSINADGSHSWNIGLNQNITTGLLENQTTQFTSLGLTAGVDIYKGLQNQNRLRRSNLAILAAQYNLSKMKDDVSLYVANAFLQILFAKENIKVQNQQLLNSEGQYKRTEELVHAGSVPRGDLLDIKATVALNKQRVIAAENTFLISKLSLAQLLQIDDFKNFDIADSNYPISESATMLLTPEAIFNKAKESRVEVKIARTNLELAERDLKIAKGAYQPSLQGFYRFNTRIGYADRITGFEPNIANPTSIIGFVEGSNQNVLQPNRSLILGKPLPFFDQFSENKGHNFGFQLNVPVLNGFSVKNSVARSKINLEKSKIALSQSELDLERNVYTAFTDAKGALNSYESAISALEARQESFNYAKERYAVGLMNVFDLEQAQTLFSNSQSEIIRTKYDYIFKVKVLEFYFGIPIIQKQ